MNETGTWFDDMTMDQIDALAKEINSQGFDHVFQVTRGGCVNGNPGVYAPNVYHDDSPGGDIAIDQGSTTGFGWEALTGYTGQYGYSGAVMHDAEFIGGRLAEDIIQMSAEAEAEGKPLLWSLVGVYSLDPEDDECNPMGWTVLYREV